ncbi:TetR/AcrR family transcriptional regulator [Lacticaseibacillus sharpeae]|uniref:Transcription regulator n=1 Tax=Lacticaseibacillus sharpeae JCM 1186 = DSM 20505 TaxID=1291052 RepID=A0A0R1ZHZ8_9LACO|nr:TetR/AcrR family transcriptional regulator [Lacticaseibacillus sharpeae]KRM54487.1 transcription regulator [Lacticaseibacillus sharpeae JCM 1186 = DSM 20505]
MRSDALANQQEIIRCAQQLFTKYGVADVSMNRIAKTLGIGAGTLYRHYASKSALCMALVYDNLAVFADKSHSYFADTDETPIIQFQTVLTWYLQFRETNIDLLQNVDAGIEATNGKNFYTSDIYQSIMTVFSQILHAAIPTLSIETCEFRADMLLAALKNASYTYQRNVRMLTREQIVAELTDLFLMRN